MDKSTLRKVYLEKRKFLSEAIYDKRNDLLTQHLLNFFEDKSPTAIHLFLPILKNKEPDLRHFLQHLLVHKPEVDVVSSVSNTRKAEMTHKLIKPSTKFITNKWGIPEPKAAETYDISHIDYVLVPMIIGSKSGHRIGYGKGYYDKFLAQCRPDVMTIGINLGPLLDAFIYEEAHDIALDFIFTPFETHKIAKTIN